MNSLLYPHPISLTSLSSSASTASLRHVTPIFTNAVKPPPYLAVRASLDAVTVNGLSFDARNPTLSSSYRNPSLPKPNPTVLEAQTRVCTGPTQTKPLGEDQAFRVLDTILRSVIGELKDDGDEPPVSSAHLGAFFAAMTIRASCFPEATRWSDGERRAMEKYWPLLVRSLPPEVVFVADPEGSLSPIGPMFVGNGASEMRLVGALREVLAGGHLGFEEVQGCLRDVLPLKSEGNKVSEALLSALLIGQRMNR